jgi:hypothetical protein
MYSLRAAQDGSPGHVSPGQTTALGLTQATRGQHLGTSTAGATMEESGLAHGCATPAFPCRKRTFTVSLRYVQFPGSLTAFGWIIGLSLVEFFFVELGRGIRHLVLPSQLLPPGNADSSERLLDPGALPALSSSIWSAVFQTARWPAGRSRPEATR